METRRRRLPFRRLGRTKRGAKPGQASGAGEGGEEQAVGLQGAADQGERSGKVVDGVEHADRDDEIEGAVGKGEAILVALDSARRGRERETRIGGSYGKPTLAQPPGEIGMAAAEVERRGEVAPDKVEPLEKLAGGAGQEIVGAGARRGAVAPEPAESTVERPVLSGARVHCSALQQSAPSRQEAAMGGGGGEDADMPRPVHFEIHAADMDRAQRFYESLFGWSFQSWGDGSYRLIETGTDGPGINGGMIKRRGPEPAGGEPVTCFMCTIDVGDVDAFVAKAEALGGSIALAKMAVPGVGWLAYVKDSEGNILGLLQEDASAA